MEYLYIYKGTSLQNCNKVTECQSKVFYDINEWVKIHESHVKNRTFSHNILKS